MIPRSRFPLQRLTGIGLVLVLVLVLAAPTVASLGAEATSAAAAAPVSVTVSAKAIWVDTGVDVAAGGQFSVSAAGSWNIGCCWPTVGPDGQTQPWYDNFFNITDIGTCGCTTLTAHQGALIGYIGASPPAAGSYHSSAVLPQAQEVFLVGSNFSAPASSSGRLWLGFNDDAYSANGNDNFGQVVAQVNLGPPPPLNYVALGDSFSSGEGVPPFDPATDHGTNPGQNLCHRSDQTDPNNQAFPKLLAGPSFSSVNVQLFFRACSGATVGNVRNGQYNEVGQLGALGAGVKLVTISIGGNDVGFDQVVRQCGSSADCQADNLVQFPGGPFDGVEQRINGQFNSLKKLFADVRADAPNASVFVVGYPLIFPQGGCDLPVPYLPGLKISTSEMQWLYKREVQLNGVVKAAAQWAGVRFVDTSTWFANHDVCQPASVRWVNPLYWPDHQEYSLHPNAAGQAVMATNLRDVTQVLLPQTPLNPNAIPTVTVPASVFDVNPGSLGINVPPIDGTRNGQDQPLTPGAQTLLYGTQFQAGATVTGTMFSTPVDLGSTTAAADGTVQLDTVVPAGTPPGLHEIELTGLDINGNPQRLVRTISMADPGWLTPLAPARILDTRNGTGLAGTFGPGQTRDLTVVGVGGVPATGVAAVIMNVTVTQPTKAGWLTLFPAGQSLPTASNLNFTAGQTVPNLVVVKVGTGGANAGKVSINNTGGSAAAGTAHVIADIVGYYSDGTVLGGSRFTGVTPSRILDTRNGTGLAGMFGPQQTRNLTVAGHGGVPAGADAVVLNVTATGASKSGWLTLFPTGQTLPTASNLNFAQGQTVANLVTVKLGSSDSVSINNTGGSSAAGTVNVIADVVGYYKSDGDSTLTAIAPQRILDTRNGTGGVNGPVGARATITVDPKTASGLPQVGSYSAVIVNVTATSPTKNGWLTVFPSDSGLPTASNLNFLAGQTVPNLVKIKVGPDGKFKINNTGGNPNAGTVQIIADIVGYYS